MSHKNLTLYEMFVFFLYDMILLKSYDSKFLSKEPSHG